MRWLKQSTSVDVPVGPFLDSTDAVTAETALTITQPDIRLKKNNADWAQKAAAQTLTHEENGNYEVTLDATDTNTLGLLRLHVAEAGALPVWEDFMILPAQVWDSLFGADVLQVHAIEISNGLITAAAVATDAFDADALAADAATEIANAVGALSAGLTVERAGYLGDFNLGSVIDVPFITRIGNTLTTLIGSPVLSVYRDDNISQTIDGVTLTVNQDGITGSHHGIVDTGVNPSSVYAGGSNYKIMLTAGTVGGISVVGLVVGTFSIQARSALMPIAAGTKIGLAAGGQVGLDFGNTINQDATLNLVGTTINNVTNLAAALIILADLSNDIITRIGVPVTTIAGDIDALETGGLTAEQATQLANIASIVQNPAGVKKNTALANFGFRMVNLQGLPVDGLTIVAERKLDGGAFAPCANIATSLGSRGLYSINLAASDLNGDMVTLVFSAPSAGQTMRDRVITIITEP